MARPATFDHLVGKKKPLTKTVPIVLDPELAEEYEHARHARDLAQTRATVSSDNTEVAFALIEAEQRLEELRRQLEETEAVVVFKFRGIGRSAFNALLDKHQPTAEQRAVAKGQGWDTLAWNPDTFPPAVISACLVEPELTPSQVLELWESPDWNQAELQVILNAAVEVNGQRRTVELGKDWLTIRPSEPKSDSA